MGVSRKQSTPNFRKTKIFYPLIRTCTYVCVSGSKTCSFFGKFDLLCFLETPVLRFAFLPYYLRDVGSFVNMNKMKKFVFTANSSWIQSLVSCSFLNLFWPQMQDRSKLFLFYIAKLQRILWEVMLGRFVAIF